MIRWIEIKHMKPVAQQDTSTCWLASYKMMFMWAGRPVSEISYLMSVFMGDDVEQEALTDGLEPAQWLTCADTFGLYSYPGQKLAFDDMTDMLMDNGPVLLHGKFSLGMHTIVLVGVNDKTKDIAYLNPAVAVLGEKPKIRWSSYTHYAQLGMVGNMGRQAVLQHW